MGAGKVVLAHTFCVFLNKVAALMLRIVHNKGDLMIWVSRFDFLQ